MTDLKIFIVTMNKGSDTFKETVFASDRYHAKEVAEAMFDAWCINARRLTAK